MQKGMQPKTRVTPAYSEKQEECYKEQLLSASH